MIAKLTHIILCAAACSLAALTPVAAQAPAPAGTTDVEIQRGVEYANHDGVALKGDLYQPKAAGKYPAIIAVHGGGWQGGSPASYSHWGPFYAQRGYVVFAISYRLSRPGQKTYPQAVQDVRAAIQFVRGRGEAIRADGERIGLQGGSAGGHLVSLTALAGDEAPFANAYPNDPFASVSARVKTVVSFYGVYDLLQQWNHDVLHRPLDNIAEKFLGVSPVDNRKIYFESSPISYAIKSKATASFFMINGTEDDVVDRAQSDSFLLTMKQAGFFVRRIVVQGAGHYFESDPIEAPFSKSGEAAGAVLRFLKDRL